LKIYRPLDLKHETIKKLTSLVIIKILLVASISAYLLSSLFYGLKRDRYGIILFTTGWIGSIAIFLINWLEANAPPFGNMYQVHVFLSICFLPLYLFLSHRDKFNLFGVTLSAQKLNIADQTVGDPGNAKRLLGFKNVMENSFRENLGWTGAYFAAVSGLSLLGAFFMSPDITWKRMPALQSPWFVPHVTSYMISYALAAVAFVIYLIGVIRQKKVKDSDNRYELAVYGILGVAFPFMTFGMLSGALWAEEAWGNYWSWDRKETWSLITWTLYLIYFHCLAKKELRNYAGLVQVLAFLALITTFFLVNLWPKLSSVLHSYSS
jgi:ABC-type transport system involved in cytochrome c biogenesis permease subunit